MSENKQAYISHVHLKGYKSIRDMEIDLLPGLNIIIGPNGSGKTNFVQGLSRVLFGGNNFAVENTNNLNAIIYFNDSEGNKDVYHAEMRKDKFKVSLKSEEIPNIEYDSKEISKLIEVNPNSFIDYLTKFSQFQKQAQSEFGSIFFPVVLGYGIKGFISLLDSETKIIIDFDNESIDLSIYESAFENSFSDNFSFQKNSLKNYSQIKFISDLNIKIDLINNLKKYSLIQNIRIREPFVFNKYKNKIIIDFLLLEFYLNDDWFTWKDLSDGTKRIFYLIAEILSTKGLVIIEEPELGIHPDQLSRLMDFLNEQSRTKQIIITTHSPQVLNELKEDELDRIIVTRHEGERGTQMYHLSEEEKGFAKGYMENGAFLSDYWVQSGFMNEAEIV